MVVRVGLFEVLGLDGVMKERLLRAGVWGQGYLMLNFNRRGCDGDDQTSLACFRSYQET